MKKYLFSALALPLLFACSSEDFDEKVISNDQFAGIEKVNATFTMDEGPITRMDNGTGWTLANGDLYGFAWMGDGTVITNSPADGKAYQNHNLIQTSGRFEPQTSIYVGKYYIYRPYDETTVTPQAINFNSLINQPLAAGYESTTDAWKKLAESAIVIADKWTDILPEGRYYNPENVNDFTTNGDWDKPGIAKPYKVFAAFFSNQTGLDLKYEKNNPSFTAAKTITGATDINLTYAAGQPVGAADIYGATVQLAGASNSFTYAPTESPNGTTHSGTYWADKSNLGAANGFTFAAEAPITLTPADVKNGISTGDEGSKGWFWFNSLPVTDGSGALATTNVTTVLNTSYGVVTVTEPLDGHAYVFDKFNAAATSPKWIKLVAGDASKDKSTTTPMEWGFDAHNTFVNQYGNHKGKYALTVDFSTGVMDGMHIKDDRHLQKLLKFYLASGKTEDATLLLDKDADNEFKISKISIALLQTINAGAHTVKVKACTDAAHTPDKIVVTQDGQTGDLANKTEVPDLNNVFAVATEVILAKNTNWTWTEGAAAEGKIPEGKLTIDANVSKITNEGTLTVNATNVQLSEADVKIINAKDATMNITKVTTVKNTLHNYGTLNVGSASNTTAELRAYGPKWIVNNATSLTEHGVINNYGVVGVTAGTSGQFNNYGLINMMNDDAITLLTSNEKGTTPFKNTFDASTNKMGTVVLPTGNPYAIVSVSNAAENGFIKYNWTAATYAHDPGNVKYNTIVVSNDIEFTGDAATEIQYIEFDGTNRALVVNPAAASKLTNLKGIIVKDNSSIVIEKTNEINCAVGAFLGKDATVYKGGAFTVAGAAFATPTNTTMYLGTWSLDQIVEY